MCLEQISIIQTVGLIFVGAMQAVFAGCLLWATKKQNDIIKNQTSMMECQKNISAEQAKFNRILPMMTEYNSLANARYNFWKKLEEALNKAYNDKVFEIPNGTQPLSLSLLITYGTFPSGFNPSEKVDLNTVVVDNSDDWTKDANNRTIWNFATHVYKSDEEQNWTGIDKYRSRLADFWDTWARLQKDLFENIEPDRNELLMLTWLELALVGRSEWKKGEGKTALFQLAKDMCSR